MTPASRARSSSRSERRAASSNRDELRKRVARKDKAKKEMKAMLETLEYANKMAISLRKRSEEIVGILDDEIKSERRGVSESPEEII